MIDENLSGVEYLETDIADEYRIDWYTIDGVIYGMSSDGKILDSDGDPLVNDSNARWNIERDKAAQKLNKLTTNSLLTHQRQHQHARIAETMTILMGTDLTGTKLPDPKDHKPPRKGS